MAKRTGSALAFKIAVSPGAAAAVKVLRGWDFEDADQNVSTTACGDPYNDRDSLRGDYTVNWNTLLEIAATYVIPNNVRGQIVNWAAHILDSDTNGILSGTGLCTRFRLEGAYDGAVLTSGTILAKATAPVWDLSPAT